MGYSFFISTRSLRQLAAPSPLGVGVEEGVRPSCDYHWTLTGPAHPLGGPYGSPRAGNITTNHKFNRDFTRTTLGMQ